MPHRCRPIPDVLRDLSATERLPWYKRKMAMLLDNNLGGDLSYAKELLHAIAGLKLWGLGVQFSIECLRDEAFVQALAAANCRMAFVGMESLEPRSLAAVKKNQNRVEEYREAFDRIHRLGILTFTGYMFALDEDTPEYYERLPRLLEEVGTTVILPSIAIPLYGTPLYRQVVDEGRLVDRDLSHYEGDHIVFRHKHMADGQIHEAYALITADFYSWRKILRRLARFMGRLEKRGPLREHFLKMAILTFIYLKLSLFQRHHARVKIRGVETKPAATGINGDRKAA
jgi:hypothetical protein